MQKIISYPISILFVIIMLIVLCVFHALQWIAFNLFGYKAHNITVNGLVWWLMACTGILGTSYKFRQEEELPTDRPIIFVSNHQSMFDIPMIIWFLERITQSLSAKKN